MAQADRPYFDFPGRGNFCCVPDCGVRRKLLCVKNGKFVRNPRECLRVWNGNRCRSDCCGFGRNGRGGRDGGRDGGRFGFDHERWWWRRCEFGNCNNRNCCGRGRGFGGGCGGGFDGFDGGFDGFDGFD